MNRALNLIDLCCHLTRIADLPFTRRVGFTVLMYHKVMPDDLVEDYPFPNLVISESNFKQHIRIAATRFQTMTVSEAAALDWNSQPRSKPIICVTFDDGYSDNHEIAAPILNSAGIAATFYAATRFIAGDALWFDIAGHALKQFGNAAVASTLREAIPEISEGIKYFDTPDDLAGFLKRIGHVHRMIATEAILARFGTPPPNITYRPMSTADLRSLAHKGHEIGSHTVNHPILTQLSADEIEFELKQSALEIAHWTGEKPASICYPNGEHDEAIRLASSNAGYKNGVTTRIGFNDPNHDRFAIARRFVSESNSCGSSPLKTRAAFHAEITGIHDAARRARQAARSR